MMTTTQASRAVRLVAIAGVFTFTSLICLFIFNAAIQPRQLDGPVEEWIRVGIDLHRVDELNSMNVFSSSEYKAEHERVLADAKNIARHSEFPGTSEAYIEYQENRVKGSEWSAALWFAVLCSLILSFSAFSWLHGASSAIACFTDKTATQSSEPGY